MTDTGRLKAPLRAAAARHVYRGDDERARQAALLDITAVDRAHLVMLDEQGLVSRATVAELLRVVEEQRATGFEAVLHAPTPRGVYMAWEGYLVERLGAAAGGALHTGRSRNDLNATLAQLDARRTWVDGGTALAELLDTLAAAAERWARLVMPISTNAAPAAPGTLGHWVGAVAVAIDRDCRAWTSEGADGLRRSPMGAGATVGTTMAIDALRVADLLGFEEAPVNTIDAVATREPLLRLSATAVSATTTLARAALSLLQWLGPEHGYLHLPDDLSGASSNLPQKRNPFVLEHVVAAQGAALGAFVAATSMTAAAPFASSISSGTEALGALREGFRALQTSAELMAMVIDGLEPAAARMEAAAAACHTTAAAVCEQLAVAAGISFREAHHIVGEAVSALEARGAGLATLDTIVVNDRTVAVPPVVAPAEAVAALTSAGAPGTASCVDGCAAIARSGAGTWRAAASGADARWSEAARRLDVAVSDRISGARP